MEKEDLNGLVPKVDPRLVAKNAGKFEDSVRYYDAEMQKLLSAMSFEERRRIPEYESKYSRERLSEVCAGTGPSGKAAQYAALFVVLAVSVFLAFGAYDIGHSFGLNRWDARVLSSCVILAVITFVFIFSGVWIKRPRKRSSDYSKMSSEERLRLYSEYSYQKGAIKKMLGGEN